MLISRNNNRDLERGKKKRKKERKKNSCEENGNRGRSTQVETHEHYISRSSLLELFQSSFLLIILFPSRCYYTPRTAVSNREKGNERSNLSEERQRERRMDGLTSRARGLRARYEIIQAALPPRKFITINRTRSAEHLAFRSSPRIACTKFYTMCTSSKVAVRLHRNHRAILLSL